MKTIYYNGQVYTGVENLQQAFVVENGMFVYVGDSKNAKKNVCDEDQLVDLQGKFVCPGFNDSHMHVLGFGKMLRDIQLAKHTDSLKGILAYLKEQSVESEGWILGRGDAIVQGRAVFKAEDPSAAYRRLLALGRKYEQERDDRAV